MFRFDFMVPAAVDIAESPVEDRRFTRGSLPNPQLFALRAAFVADGRWDIHRISSDPIPQILRIWAPMEPTDDGSLEEIQLELLAIISSVIPGTTRAGSPQQTSL